MSEWRERANKRRDARQTKAPVTRAPGGSKRDTKKWCRGKVGVEHTPLCIDYNRLKNTSYLDGWKVLVCTKCRKELDTWAPVSWMKDDRKPPAWVCTVLE